jgi:DNA replication initiation complex subunit (GINS family)
MGITTTKEATSIQFDVPVPDKHFKLPDFPIKKTESFFNNEDFDEDMDMEMDMESINEDMNKLSKLSFEEWKKMALADKEDTEMQNMSEEELREMYDMIQKMIKMRNGE